jgi:hypothetical protein
MSDERPRKDWASDPRVLSEFCTCPSEKYWLVDVPEDKRDGVTIIDLNCPVHGERAESSPF